jgi:hypothetical protein
MLMSETQCHPTFGEVCTRPYRIDFFTAKNPQIPSALIRKNPHHPHALRAQKSKIKKRHTPRQHWHSDTLRPEIHNLKFAFFSLNFTI